MIKRLADWLDDRTGYQGILHEALYESIPGGARWRYVWGSTLLFAFTVQLITGFFLWMNYSPSSQTAWESVYFIQYAMSGGWLLRGIHHFMAQAMIVLLALHLLQVIIDGAYRAPREVNFWIGLILLQIVLGLSLTGYLLPWDQKGYWATQVATNIMGIVPVIGPSMQRILVGGTSYGHLTLTRFFALHAGLLPLSMMGMVGVHLYVFRRHGITVKKPHTGPDATFWVDQVLRDAVACLAVMVLVLVLVLWRGAELGAPADPSVPYSAARPEWYFLFLFQFLKSFPGSSEIYGAVVIPGIVMMILALMPILGRWKLGHRFNVGFLFVLLIGVVILTVRAKQEDYHNTAYQTAVEHAEVEAARVVELAQSPTGIPAQGAASLTRNDPFIQGPRLFAQSCASCHRYDGHDGMGVVPPSDISPQAASDLKGFASRTWITGLLDPAQIQTPHYFGATKFKDDEMAQFVKTTFGTPNDEKRQQVKAAAAALSAEAGLKSQRALDAQDGELIKSGRALITGTLGCTSCHTFYEEKGSAPDLTGYGSRKWLIDFISDPAHERFYGANNDRMPSFGKRKILDEKQIGLIADWLRGEWYSREDAQVSIATTKPATEAK